MTPPFPTPKEPILSWIPKRSKEVRLHLGIGPAKNAVSQLGRWHMNNPMTYPEAHLYRWENNAWVEIFTVNEGDTVLPWSK